MTLVGKPGLVADVGDLISGAQARFGKFDACHIHKAGGRQASVLLKGANQRLFAQGELVGQRIKRGRFL